MNSTRLILLIVAVIIWQGIWIPNKVKRKIEKQVAYEGGNICNIERVSFRYPIYLVEYKQKGQLMRVKVEYDLVGNITKWL